MSNAKPQPPETEPSTPGSLRYFDCTGVRRELPFSDESELEIVTLLHAQWRWYNNVQLMLESQLFARLLTKRAKPVVSRVILHRPGLNPEAEEQIWQQSLSSFERIGMDVRPTAVVFTTAVPTAREIVENALRDGTAVMRNGAVWIDDARAAEVVLDWEKSGESRFDFSREGATCLKGSQAYELATTMQLQRLTLLDAVSARTTNTIVFCGVPTKTPTARALRLTSEALNVRPVRWMGLRSLRTFEDLLRKAGRTNIPSQLADEIREWVLRTHSPNALRVGGLCLGESPAISMVENQDQPAGSRAWFQGLRIQAMQEIDTIVEQARALLRAPDAPSIVDATSWSWSPEGLAEFEQNFGEFTDAMYNGQRVQVAVGILRRTVRKLTAERNRSGAELPTTAAEKLSSMLSLVGLELR